MLGIRHNVEMANETHIDALQKALQQDKLDGWLFYSFRGSDPIAENILRLDHAKFTTRRWFYFVPAKGTPQKIVHAIESEMLDSLPDGIHSGLAKAGAKGVFFYFQAPAKEGGKLHFWKYFDLRDQAIIDNRYIIANLIACQKDTPRAGHGDFPNDLRPPGKSYRQYLGVGGGEKSAGSRAALG